ncbi:hypothetical protein [Salibacter halophilus]|uniref:Lipoprotein n=1 Tax=Salibacter halophilus TaxID=1803916 RepID=A0A6N6M8R3_9FLAO|nr:hypothetical protein [Salibacter halophilus]KAB1066284.1 hypothetical protein F3059_02060 [Salibacter halophilus]
MNKFLLLSFWIIATLFSSTSCGVKQKKNDKTIALVNGVKYYLQDNEKEIAREESIINFHDSIFNKYETFNWPLYKVLADRSDHYKAFISIPVKIKRAQLAGYIENDSTNRHIKSDSHDAYQRYFYERDGSYIVSVLSEKKDFFWTYSIISSDSSKVAFLMNDSAFIKRVNMKKLK